MKKMEAMASVSGGLLLSSASWRACSMASTVSLGSVGAIAREAVSICGKKRGYTYLEGLRCLDSDEADEVERTLNLNTEVVKIIGGCNPGSPHFRDWESRLQDDGEHNHRNLLFHPWYHKHKIRID